MSDAEIVREPRGITTFTTAKFETFDAAENFVAGRGFLITEQGRIGDEELPDYIVIIPKG